MRAISHAILENGVLCDGPLLEVGCGGCAFLREITERHPLHLSLGIDSNPAAFSIPRNSGLRQPKLAQADLHSLPFSDNSLAGVIGLDAFDQQGVRLHTALLESRRVLTTGGILLLRVSAYPWLQGEHDRAFGTERRYKAKEISVSLRQAGFKIERITHANILMLLPAIALRLAIMANLASVEAGFSPARALRACLIGMLRAESVMLRLVKLPAGLSLYALAQKDDA